MTQIGLAPRIVAHRLLDQIMTEGRLLPELIAAGAFSKLDAEDRARAQRLVLQTLRSVDRADRMLKPFLKKKPPLTVQNVLRLGVVELKSGEADHGVVNACVEIVGRNKRTQAMKGLVNAVLRKVATSDENMWTNLPLPQLPKWLRKPLMDAWGNSAIQGIERAHFAGAPLDITAARDPEGVAELLGGTLLPTGTIRLENAGQVSKLPGFDEGSWWVQDAAAAMPVKVMAPQKGEKILDLCSAPGGKTLQIAAAGADVVAVDISEQRMRRVEENLARTGLIARTVVSDAFEFDETGFDVILLDAPCSATGTIRRHPDLPFAKDGSEFGALIGQQDAMIDHALSLLKPGGRLIFCTCSLLPDEGEVQVEDALARHNGLSVDTSARERDGISADWFTEEGGIRLRPDYWSNLGGMDGFYIAALTKPA